jgi:3D (Asp-Asp-Asp) domain-containing protein
VGRHKVRKFASATCYGPALVRRVCAFAAVLALGLVSGATAAGPTLKSLESQRRAAILDLYALDSHVTAAQRNLSALQQRVDALRHEQQQLKHQLIATRGTLQTSQAQLAANLRSLYKRGNINTLAVVLGAQSLDDAVSQIDTLNAVTDQNEKVVTITTRAQTRLTALRTTIARRETQLQGAVSEARRTLATVTAARDARVAFVDRLRRAEQLKSHQINALEARVRRAEKKSATLTAAAAAAETATAAPTPAPSPANDPPPAAAAAPAPSGGRTITVSSTGYSLPGHTATGLPVGWGVVAVDPNVIPLGTKLTIPGYGEGVAADTGSAVRGNDIDLWFPTLAQARAWGRRAVTITLH